jgi:polysaccharide biosynthesis transport protein
MTRGEGLYVLRRWRLVILVGVLIGVVVGWFSAPGTATGRATFEAVHSLIVDPQARRTSLVDQVAARVRLGAVPDRVATRLGLDRQLVRSMVSAKTPSNRGVVLVIGRSKDPAQAETVANVTAEELLVEFGGSSAPLRTLELAVAAPVHSDDVKARSAPGRALLLGAFGLFLGVGAAFGVERFDKRIRSKAAAEKALGVAVMAEVPRMSRSGRGRMLTGAQPSSFIEAYRGLRTNIDWWTSRVGNGDGHRVIVVTSATGGEGATTTVAHLAAAFGEIGRSVVVISANLHHPRLHLYFDRALEPGLTDVLRGAPDARRLTDLNLATTTRGVRFVSSGAPVRNAAPLLDRIGDHLRDALSLGDIVLVDAPPLLTTSDGADVARHADAVLFVVQSGRTSVSAAARSVELLERLGVPVLGAVLVGSNGSSSEPKGSKRSGDDA